MRNSRKYVWVLLLVSAVSVWAIAAFAQQDDMDTDKGAGKASESKPACKGAGETTDASCTGCCSSMCISYNIMTGRDIYRCSY